MNLAITLRAEGEIVFVRRQPCRRNSTRAMKERQRPMFDVLTEPFSDVALATVKASVAAYAAGGVEVVLARPDRIELRVPGELKAVSAAENLLVSSLADIPPQPRESIIAAFREILANAIEYGCRLDRSKRVEVSCVRLRRVVVCRIKDPGAGFDPARLTPAAINNPEGDPERHARVRDEQGMRPGGFGLLLTAELVEELIYNERHNEVLFVKYLPESARAQAAGRGRMGREGTER